MQKTKKLGEREHKAPSPSEGKGQDDDDDDIQARLFVHVTHLTFNALTPGSETQQILVGLTPDNFTHQLGAS